MPWTDLTEAPTEWPAPNAAFNGERGTELYDAYISAMAYAEECGFDWVAANEHHYSPYSLMANCNLVGAALTQRTKNVKLAMLGNLLPLLNPIRVAEEYAMLDVMSGGRLVAGFVRGIPHEYIAYNVDPSQSRARTARGARVDRQGMDRAGSLRLGRRALPVSVGVDLAATAPKTASAHSAVRVRTTSPRNSSANTRPCSAWRWSPISTPPPAPSTSIIASRARMITNRCQTMC